MTEVDVKGALKSLGLPLDPLPASYARVLEGYVPFKSSVKMAGGYYDAIFLFPEDTRRLGKVVISTLDYSREHALKLHSSLLRALTKRYGRPGGTESLGSSMATLTRWTFKTTTIVLSLYTDTATPGRHVTQVAITYAPTVAALENPKDKLLGLALLRALGEVSRNSR